MDMGRGTGAKGVAGSVRDAGPGDIPAMMELARQSETASHWREEDYARIFEEGTPARMALVVEEAGAIAGFIVAVNVGAEWEIENVVVAKSLRGRGLGGQLMAEFLERARQRGGESVFLEVRRSNEAARGLYGRWGFVETGARKGYYSGPVEDAVVYKKSLESSKSS
jgi:ribosomal-protein-alanine acetyltransferase